MLFAFQALARYLDSDQPVYALQPPGLDGSLPYLTDIEDMAAHYIREIQNLQPQGPYHLAGYSGGLVAFQMGCELLKRSDRIGLLALFDSPEWHYEARLRAILACGVDSHGIGFVPEESCLKLVVFNT